MSDTLAPVIILASRGSRGSALAELLGAHPGLCAAPHLNVLAFDYGWQQHQYCQVPRDTNYHGVLRFIAHQLLGEQTIQSVLAARRWLGVRSEHSGREIYDELASLVAPKRIVDYSPLYAQNLTVMRRVAAAMPEATFVHLVCNPWTQAEGLSPAVWQAVNASLGYWAERGLNHPCLDSYEIGEQYVDWSVTPPVFDPQFSWFRTQKAAMELFQEIPAGRGIRVQAEKFFTDPMTGLADLLDFIGIEADKKTRVKMLKAEGSVFASAGPYEAPAGVDLDIVGKSVGQMFGTPVGTDAFDPDLPLPWRGDEDHLLPEVVSLAQELGYCVAA